MYTISLYDVNKIALLYKGGAIGRAEYKVGDTVDICGITIDGEADGDEVRRFFLRSLVSRLMNAGLPIVFIAPDEKSLPYIQEMNFLKADNEWYQYAERIEFPSKCKEGSK